MMNIIEYNKHKVVDSLELYEAMGLSMANYSRWCKKAMDLGLMNVEWFVNFTEYEDCRKIKTRCYFNVVYASGLVLLAHPSKRVELRRFFAHYINDLLNINTSVK